MRAVRSITAAGLLVVLLIGAPVALWRWGHASSLLGVDWLRALTAADDGRLLLGVLSLVAWGAWIVLAVTIVLEIVAVASRGRVRVSLPGTGWLRPVIASLVVAATGLPLAASAVAAPASTPAPLQDATAALPAIDLVSDDLDIRDDGAHLGEAQTVADSSTSSTAARIRHVVQPNDDLWSLAENYLGSGARWREIAQANPHLDADAALTAGHRLVIPTDATATAPQKPAPVERSNTPEPPPPGHEPTVQRTVVVKRGDSLWHLAAEHLGDPLRWPEIHALNRDLIDDPDDIDVGWTLTLPPADGAMVDGDHPAVALEADSAASPTSWSTPAPQTPSHDDYQGQVGEEARDGDDGRGAGHVASAPPPTTGSDDVTDDAPHDPAPATVAPPGHRDPAQPQTNEDASRPETTHTPADTPAQPAHPAQPGGSEAQAPDQAVQSQVMDASSVVVGIVGSIGAGLAAALLTQLGWRRWGQRARRGVGRRIPSSSPSATRFEAALGRRAAELPETVEQPVATQLPTEVLLGWDAADRPVTIDLEGDRLLQIEADADDAQDCTAALITSLLCSEWTQDAELVVVGGHADWTDAVNASGSSTLDDTQAGLRLLLETAAARRVGLNDCSLDEVRADADRGSAFAPLVFVFCEALTAAELTQAAEALDLGLCGVSVACLVHRAVALPQLAGRVLRLSQAPPTSGRRHAQLTGVERPFTPQLVSEPARHALIELFATADSDETSPAPWWSDEDTWPDNVTPFPHRSNRSSEESALDAWSLDDITTPTLLLLGPVELRGARGPEPTRSRYQCEEYCAWLLEHPGGTPTDMAEALVVAESTRRSNMSRLRTWLGSDDIGNQYLPDAYTGRLSLHDDVTSDWEQFNIILAGGVNRASPLALEKALSLVRGEPLGGLTEWQWSWAAELASDMVSMICDAAVTLALGALGVNDVTRARWAVTAGFLASPDDQRLMVTMVRLEHAAGNHDRVQKLVRDITRRARAAGEDLSDESIRAIQHVMSLGGRRARAE